MRPKTRESLRGYLYRLGDSVGRVEYVARQPKTPSITGAWPTGVGKICIGVVQGVKPGDSTLSGPVYKVLLTELTHDSGNWRKNEVVWTGFIDTWREGKLLVNARSLPSYIKRDEEGIKTQSPRRWHPVGSLVWLVELNGHWWIIGEDKVVPIVRGEIVGATDHWYLKDYEMLGRWAHPTFWGTVKINDKDYYQLTSFMVPPISGAKGVAICEPDMSGWCLIAAERKAQYILFELEEELKQSPYLTGANVKDYWGGEVAPTENVYVLNIGNIFQGDTGSLGIGTYVAREGNRDWYNVIQMQCPA